MNTMSGAAIGGPFDGTLLAAIYPVIEIIIQTDGYSTVRRYTWARNRWLYDVDKWAMELLRKQLFSDEPPPLATALV